jgi:hypothetical protein
LKQQNRPNTAPGRYLNVESGLGQLSRVRDHDLLRKSGQNLGHWSSFRVAIVRLCSKIVAAKELEV